MEHLDLTQIHEALSVISHFHKSPLAYISELNKQRGIQSQNPVKNEDYIKQRISLVNSEARARIAEIRERIDAKNRLIASSILGDKHPEELDYYLNLKPVDRVGIYIPNTLPSSALTYLSMATAAGVKNIVVYTAQDSAGHLDALTVYICRQYGAVIWGGPARVGFPALARGFNQDDPKVDLICGPCGNRLNLIKNLSALIYGCGIDMNAGASDLCIITNKTDRWTQIHLDLFSQLEHGKDSFAKLIIVGAAAKESFMASEQFETLSGNQKINVVYVRNIQQAANFVNQDAPECLEVIMDDHKEIIRLLSNYGILYLNTSSSLGDYMVVGRGCSDPTNGFAKGQSGISPYTFLNVRPVVDKSRFERSALASALYLAGYEDLSAHKKVIDYYLNQL